MLNCWGLMRVRGRRRYRAFVLLTTMFLVLVLGVMVRVAMLRMPVVNSSSALTAAQERARRAAQSGAEYIASQLRENPDWRGGTTQAVVVDQPGLRVIEDQGNVIGYLTDDDGGRSEFRVRFNYNDGARAQEYDADENPLPNDGLPNSGLTVDHPHVSVNNLREDVYAQLPYGGGDGGRVESFPEELPRTDPHSACVFVEGVATDGEEGVAARQTLQTMLSVVPKRSAIDGVLMGAGGVKMKLGEAGGKVYLGGAFLGQATNRQVGLRSKETLSAKRVQAGAGTELANAPLILEDGMRAELGYNMGAGEASIDLSGIEPDRIRSVQENANDGKDFYNLEWDQVHKASADETKSLVIKGGTYVYGKDPANPSQRSLYYYDMPLSEYLDKAQVLADSPNRGVKLSANFAEVRSSENLQQVRKGITLVTDKEHSYYEPRKKDVVKSRGMELTVKGKDMKIAASDKGVTDFAIVPRRMGRFDQDDPAPTGMPSDNITADDIKVELRDTTVYGEGNITVSGGIQGVGGTVVSEGNVNLLAGRSLSMASEGKTTKEQMKEFKALNNDALALEDLGELELSDLPADETRHSAMQLNVYCKGDLNVSSFVDRYGSYRNLAFSGLLYSWGDVRLRASRDGNTRGGVLKLRGAMVAYGADPASGRLGGTGKGMIDITARHANLFWDPRYLPSLAELQPEGSSIFTLQRTFMHFLEK